MIDQQAAPLTADVVRPLTAEEEAKLRASVDALNREGADLGLQWSNRVPTMLFATLDRDRSAPSDGGLRALFARYIESHDEWDTEDGWCMKHLPTVAEVRSALAATPTPAPAPADLRLDVERLARAMWHPEVVSSEGHTEQDHSWCTTFDEADPEDRQAVLDDASAIAREYAALSDSSAGVEGTRE